MADGDGAPVVLGIGKTTTACSAARQARWRGGVIELVLKRRRGPAGDRRGGGKIVSRTTATKSCREKSKEVSGRCAGARGEDWDQKEVAWLTGLPDLKKNGHGRAELRRQNTTAWRRKLDGKERGKGEGDQGYK